MRSTRRNVLRGLAASLFAPQAARAAEDGFLVLEARAARWPLPEAAPTKPALGFNGETPGPLLRVKKGEELCVRLVNRLNEATSLHWQGVRLPNAMDGAAGLTQPAIAPGAHFDYRFTPPDSGTYLYRALGLAQQARGMAGVLIVDEVAPPAAALDFVAVLQEFAREKPAEPPVLALNAAPLPASLMVAPGARIRLRLVNACANRIALVSFEGFRAFLIAIDGQACDPFEPVRNTIPVGPGARFDVMFDLPEAGRVILRGDKEPDRDLIRLKAQGDAASRLPSIAAMPLNPFMPAVIRLQDSIKQDVTLSGAKGSYSLQGKAPAGKPLFQAPRGAPVTLGFVNRAALPASFHVHGHCLRLLHDLDDGWEPYWRDSVLVNAGKAHHVALIADNPGKWLIEAISAEPGALAQTLWFEVI